MYYFLLVTHSLLRWVVLVLAAVALVQATPRWLGRRAYTPGARRAGAFFVGSLDLQLLVGLLLYLVFSPITQAAFADFGTAMGVRDLRFWAVEHLALMLLAVIVAHVGQAMARRAPADPARHRRAALSFTVATLLILAAIPWPMLGHGRPLLRF